MNSFFKQAKAVSYKTFLLAVGRGRGPLILSASKGRICKLYQNIQSVRDWIVIVCYLVRQE